MRVDDLIIEVRNPDLDRVGQFTPADLVGTTFVLRFNNVGAWEMKLPSGHPLGELLRQPGYGLVVTGPDGTVIMSGPTTGARLEQTTDNIQGDWAISGASDDLILSERLAYPTPTSADVTAQTLPYDIREDVAETVLKGYVNANLGPSAPVARQALTVEADSARGENVYGSARFHNIQELLYDIAQVGQVGYQVKQVGADLQFQVYEPEDKSLIVRMDLQNQKLSKTEYTYSSAKVTRAIVAGQGEAEVRKFVEVSNTDSLAAETAWGRRIEMFKDSRNSELDDALIQAGNEVLVDEGKTIVQMSVTPSDDQNMRFGVDWYLGDKVTVVVNDIEASAVVTEVGISIQGDGVRIGATVGTPVAVDFESKIIAKQVTTDERLANLERNTTGYGINTAYEPEGGTDDVQPTFSGPAITGSFNRFGNMAHFSILVDFDNITSFGSGQYYLTLPYPARVAYQFRERCLHDTASGTEYHISRHVDAGDDVLWLSSSDKVASSIQDVPFTATSPITLDSTDIFHIAGTYEIEA